VTITFITPVAGTSKAILLIIGAGEELAMGRVGSLRQVTLEFFLPAFFYRDDVLGGGVGAGDLEDGHSVVARCSALESHVAAGNRRRLGAIEPNSCGVGLCLADGYRYQVITPFMKSIARPNDVSCAIFRVADDPLTVGS
jgi:hypothetical protein